MATLKIVASGLALSCPMISGALPWTGSYMPTLPPKLADGQHADGAREHRRLVAENIAEHVGRHEDVELLGISDQLHGAIIDQNVLQCDAGIAFVFVNPRDDSAPKLRDLQHIGLVHRGNFLAPLERRLKRYMSDALDFRRRVDFGVDAALGPVRKFGYALRLPK